jgi:UDP-N-acetylglucosamine--N-acetylmuramyl-(pentapeptide) pyrophosphoryl-undecaprenol N-acetylglucosamine transferase
MKRRRTSTIVLAAGGTGGHLFPALAIKDELKKRGHKVFLITDKRGMNYAKLFEDITIYKVNSATFSGKNIIGKILAIPQIIKGIFEAKSLLKNLNPGVVIGFGGYPSFPTLKAAKMLNIPTCLHEQNAVLGKVNRHLAKSVDALALSFENTRKMKPLSYKEIFVTGNPVREEFCMLGEEYFPTISDDTDIHILIMGGSQGASIFSDIIPAAISTLPVGLQKRLVISQQCRKEDIENVKKAYSATKVRAELADFITNVPEVFRTTHLVIGRSGASTMSELTAAGRPAILVPYPFATDGHQVDNARGMAEAGGAWLYLQDDFTVRTLAKLLLKLSRSPKDIWHAAEEARKLGKPFATKDLADLVERLALVKGDMKIIKTKKSQLI